MPSTIEDASREGDYGTVLKLARQARGLSQRQLADNAGCSQPAISMYERGKRGLTTADKQRFARILDLPLSAFGLPPTTEEQDHDMRRRDMLAAAGLALAGIPLGLHTQPAQATTPRTATELRALAEAYRTRIADQGATLGLQNTIVTLINHTTTAISHASTATSRTELLDALGDLAGLAAYGYRDLGQHHNARESYVLAVQAARHAGDLPLAGHLVTRMAGHSMQLLQPHHALDYVAAASVITDGFSPGELANQRGITAWAYARLGQPQPVARAIGEAEEYFARRADHTPAHGHLDRGWQVRPTAAAEMYSLTGVAYRHLAAHDPRHAPEAIRRLELALRLRDETRNTTLDYLALAEAHLLGYNLDESARAAHQGLTQAEGSPSRRVQNRVQRLVALMVPHRQRSDVSDVIDHAHQIRNRWP